MGYSASAIALMVKDEMVRIMKSVGTPSEVSNYWNRRDRNGKDWGYFYEIGKEHEDGRVTGAIYREDGYKAGQIHITPKGKIKRFYQSSEEERKRAEAQALAEFLRIWGHAQAEHDCDPTLGR